jgi:uncharacterized protein (TIGR02265 family)
MVTPPTSAHIVPGMHDGADGFRLPNWEEPIDIDAILAGCPAGAMMRGMYTLAVCNQAEKLTRKRFGEKRYVPFKFYSMREHIRVVHECATASYPSHPPRLALRRMGALAIPTLRDSIVGRTLLMLGSGTGEMALGMLEKAYKQSRNSGSVRLSRLTEKMAEFELREIWDFPDTVQVGIFEAALREAVGGGAVLVRRHSLASVDLRMVWST